MEEVNNVLYESKLIGYPPPFENKVRTFCQNPGGFVAQENYDNNLAVVNGHSYKKLKSDNTNVAILCSHNFSTPFNQPIALRQTGRRIGEYACQRPYSGAAFRRDILSGKRTWPEGIGRSNVRPTMPDAVAGDITSALPYRTMMNIISFIKRLIRSSPALPATKRCSMLRRSNFTPTGSKWMSNSIPTSKGYIA